MEGCRRRKVRLYKIIPIKGNHPRTWREHTQRECNAPFSEGIELEILRTWSKDASPTKRRVGLAEDCIKIHFLRLVTLKEKSGIDRRLHRHDHFFNRWLNRCETTWSRDTSTPKTRVVSAEDYIDRTTASTKEGLDFWEIKDNT
jgi:hypothetical protein